MKKIQKFIHSTALQSMGLAAAMVLAFGMQSCDKLEHWFPYKRDKHQKKDTDTIFEKDTVFNPYDPIDSSQNHRPELKSAYYNPTSNVSPNTFSVVGVGLNGCASHMSFTETKSFDKTKNTHIVYIYPTMHYKKNNLCSQALVEVKSDYYLQLSNPDMGSQQYELHFVENNSKEIVINYNR